MTLKIAERICWHPAFFMLIFQCVLYKVPCQRLGRTDGWWGPAWIAALSRIFCCELVSSLDEDKVTTCRWSWQSQPLEGIVTLKQRGLKRCVLSVYHLLSSDQEYTKILRVKCLWNTFCSLEFCISHCGQLWHTSTENVTVYQYRPATNFWSKVVQFSSLTSININFNIISYFTVHVLFLLQLSAKDVLTSENHANNLWWLSIHMTLWPGKDVQNKTSVLKRKRIVNNVCSYLLGLERHGAGRGMLKRTSKLPVCPTLWTCSLVI